MRPNKKTAVTNLPFLRGFLPPDRWNLGFSWLKERTFWILPLCPRHPSSYSQTMSKGCPSTSETHSFSGSTTILRMWLGGFVRMESSSPTNISSTFPPLQKNLSRGWGLRPHRQARLVEHQIEVGKSRKFLRWVNRKLACSTWAWSALKKTFWVYLDFLV